VSRPVVVERSLDCRSLVVALGGIGDWRLGGVRTCLFVQL
jgi:hypothetical protein